MKHTIHYQNLDTLEKGTFETEADNAQEARAKARKASKGQINKGNIIFVELNR